MSLSRKIDALKVYSSLVYKFGNQKMNELSKWSKEVKEEARYMDSDELINWIGDYYMEYPGYDIDDIHNISGIEQLEKFSLAIIAHDILKYERKLDLWEVKQRYLYNNNIDINSISINGLNIDDDFNKLRHLAIWGNLEAIECLASYYASPNGGNNDKKCVDYWYRAAELGSVKSQERMAKFYLGEYRGLKFDAERVIHYYKCAARQGSSESLKFIREYDIDINSPIISQSEIERVSKIKYPNFQNNEQNASDSAFKDDMPLGWKVVGYVWAVIFWGYIIYEFVLT